MNILIFAGGNGTRLWPASKKSTPKQLLKFIGENTLLENTYERVTKVVSESNVYVATLTEYEKQIRKQLPKIKKSHYSLEPFKKDRGPALGLAMLIINKTSNDKTFATAWSDDHIKDIAKYKQTLGAAESYLKNEPENIIAVGIKPTFAHTGFRYINSGAVVKNSQGIFNVKKFTDKPTAKLAEKYLTSENYLWNTGYFISNTDHILNLYKKYQPKAYELLMQLEPYIGTEHQSEAIERYYEKFESFDFESILIENPQELKTIKATFDWQDVGRWSTVKDVQSKEKENLEKGLTVSHETTGSLIYNYNPKQIVSTLHVDNLVIVVTPDSVLIAKKDKSEELKHIIEKLKENKDLHKFL